MSNGDAPSESSEGDDFSDRELRWMALASEGLEPEDARKKLGLSEETVAKEVGELQEKLGSADIGEAFSDRVEVQIPDGELDDLAAEAAQAEIADERRTWLLLRMTLSELLELADTAEARADSLRDLLERLDVADRAAEATGELTKLLRVSETLRSTVEALFDDLRGELPPHPD